MKSHQPRSSLERNYMCEGTMINGRKWRTKWKKERVRRKNTEGERRGRRREKEMEKRESRIKATGKVLPLI